MNYYPVVIPTLCRYEHFKRCVESLKKNTHADKTELIIGLDFPAKDGHKEGYDKICNYIPSITGFNKITVFKRCKNYGASLNSIELANYAFSKYNAYIYTEDDNEFSPCFLDFMNKSLDRYENEEKIISVCGYTAKDYETNETKGILFTHDNCAWGLGLWKDKARYSYNDIVFFHNTWGSMSSFWSLFFKAPVVANIFANMMLKNESLGDIMHSVRNIKNNTFQVRPSKSLVRNWGYDGSGLHCPNDESMCKQEISTEFLFQNDFNTKIENSLPFSTEFFFLLPKNRLNAFYKILRIGLSCLKIRVIYKYNKYLLSRKK